MSKTVREALLYVADHPVPTTDPIDTPVWELIARALHDVATNPDPKVRGAMARATRAQQMILDRTVGRRRAGSRPISGAATAVEFRDLTAGAIEPGEQS
jgi:hypothetical protein